MDEKVVFDPNQPVSQTPSQSEVPPVGAPPPDVPSQPSAQPLQNPPPPPPPGAGPSKKMMIIGIIAIIFVLLLLIMFFIPKKKDVRSVTLNWWGLWEDERTMQALIVDFRKTHPNIQIKYSKRDPKDYRDQLTTRIKSNSATAPDIFRYHNTWLTMLGPTSADIVAPLSSDVISADEFKKNYYPVMQTDLVKNGAIYGIPLEADSLALFVDTRLFKEKVLTPPKNWRDFALVAQKLTQRDDSGKIKVAGAAMGQYNNIVHASDIISLLFAQEGVDMQKYNTPDKEKDAINFYTSLVPSDKENAIWDASLDPSKLAFAQGKLAMYFGYSWDVFDIKTLNANLPFEIYPVPAITGRNITIASYWVEGVSSKSPNQKEAMEFMQYLAQKETAQKFYSETAKVRAFGEPYARVDLADSLKNTPMVYPFVSQLKNASSTIFSSFTWDGDTGMNTRANAYLSNAINKTLDDPSTTESNISELNKGLSQIFEDYGIQQQ